MPMEKKAYKKALHKIHINSFYCNSGWRQKTNFFSFKVLDTCFGDFKS